MRAGGRACVHLASLLEGLAQARCLWTRRPSSLLLRQQRMAPVEAHVMAPVAAFGQESVKICIELNLPHLEITLPAPPPIVEKPKKERRKLVETRAVASDLSCMFGEQRYPEPVYFQAFDCVGIPGFLDERECHRIISHAECLGFIVQRRDRLVDMEIADIVDPIFAEALWRTCGLEWLLQGIRVDGMVACGLNDVVRIQKYSAGGVLGRHVDQCVRRADGRISQYSLRVFLNGCDGREGFQGGLSVFHVSGRPDPIALEPEGGLALLYPQGERCILQEEQKLVCGQKYVLRADVLFCRPGTLL